MSKAIEQNFALWLEQLKKRRVVESASFIKNCQNTVSQHKAEIEYWENLVRACPTGYLGESVEVFKRRVETYQTAANSAKKALQTANRKFEKNIQEITSTDSDAIWKLLLSRKCIEKVEVNGNNLHIYTKMIRSPERKLDKGRFRFTITPSPHRLPTVKFQNLDYDMEGYQLPHIRNESPCWGNFEQELERYYRNGDVLLMVDYIFYYLETGETPTNGFIAAETWWNNRKPTSPEAIAKFKPIKRLKKGDRVKLIGRHYGDSEHNPVWGGSQGKVRGTIASDGPREFHVTWDNGSKNGGYQPGRDIVRIPTRKPKSEISEEMIAQIDATMQQILETPF